MFENDFTTNDEFSVDRRSVMQGVAGAVLMYGLSETVDADGETIEVIVRADRVQPGFLPKDADYVDELKAEAAESQEPIVDYVKERNGVEVKNQFWLSNSLLLGVDTAEVPVEELGAIPGIRELHDNFEFEIPEPESQDFDPEFAEDGETTYGLEQIRAPQVWDEFETKGDGADVAVIDTGVDPDHPDIDIDDENFAEFDAEGNETEDAETRDSSFHGTHVSGTAVGTDAFTDDDGNNVNIGVAPEATLYHALALPGGSGTFAQIVGAMQWAVEKSVDVVNLSLGAPGFVPELIEPVRNAVEAGTVVVASSGNDGEGTAGTPGAVFDSISVGASDRDREITDFSSGRTVDTDTAWGPAAPDEWPADYVIPDVSAPGDDVLSAFPEDADPPPGSGGSDDRWLRLRGTSMAAPHVAGTIGLMQSAAASVPEEYDPRQVATALTTTATKPEDAPDGQDVRYGFGIIDALSSTSRFAADSGVEGAVTDIDGEPIASGTVELDGFPTETGSDGSYLLRADPGTYKVTADGFGFASTTESVIVEGDEFAVQDFELEDALDLELLAGQPDGLEAAEAFEIEIRVANLEAYTVEISEQFGFTGDVAVELDGEAIELGEPIEFDDPSRGQVTLTVDPEDDASGQLALDHTFEGLGDTLEVQTGPTDVFDEFIEVAVVDRETGVFTEDIVSLLDDALDPIYAIESITPEEALEAAKEADPDAFVVQSLGQDKELIEAFVDETSIPQLGVVYLQQAGGTGEPGEVGQAADGIFQKSETTGDPREVVDAAFQGLNPPIAYDNIDEDHPIFENADVDSPIVLYQPFPVQIFGGFHSFFEDYEGEVAGQTIAEVGDGPAVIDGEDGLAVDDLSRTVLAASLGLSAFVGRRVFRDEAEEVLASAVRFVADAPPVTVLENQPERVDSGGTAGLVVSVEDLVEYEISLTEASSLNADDLTLSLDGDEIPFDEPVEFEDPITGEVTVAIEAADGAVGEFSIGHRFVTLDRFDEEQTTEAVTGPTAVYTPPLAVPEDISPINAAVDLAVEGEEIVLADGVYEEDAPDAPAIQTGLSIETPGITLRAEEGARPSIIHERDLASPRIINVSADDVTIEGIEANLIEGDVDEKNSIGSGVRINADGVTVRDIDASGTFGIQLEGGISNIRIEECEAIETVIGVGTDSGAFGDVTDVTITDVRVTDRPDSTFRAPIVIDAGASRVEVTDCEILMEDGEEGIWLEGPFDGGEDSLIANNEILGDEIEEGPFTGFNAGILLDEVEAVVEDNVIDDTFTGIQVGDFGFGEESVVIRNNEIRVNGVGYGQNGDFVTLEENVIEAEIGVNLDGGFFGIDADQILARFNDLSEAALPFAGEANDGFGAPEPFLFDCRQNYVGDRDYHDTIAEGDVVYDPFLTEPPVEVNLPEPTEIGTDLYLDPNETYGLGIPGPVDLTIWDVLAVEDGGGHNEFDGTVEQWNTAKSGGPGGGESGGGEWQHVTGRGELSDLDSLLGFRVEPGAGVRAVLDFQFDEDSPPGRRGDLSEIEVVEGTNIVCAGGYGDDELFDEGTATIESVESKELGAPDSQLGEEKAESDADKLPFTAYYVEVSEPGTIEVPLKAYDPTQDDLYEAFGLEPEIHDDPGVSDVDGFEIDRLPSVEDVLEELDDERAAGAVEFVLARHAIYALEDSDGDDIVSTVTETLEEETAGVAEEEPVKLARTRVLQQVTGTKAFEDEIPDIAERDARELAARDDEAVSSLLGAAKILLGD